MWVVLLHVALTEVIHSTGWTLKRKLQEGPACAPPLHVSNLRFLPAWLLPSSQTSNIEAGFRKEHSVMKGSTTVYL